MRCEALTRSCLGLALLLAATSARAGTCDLPLQGEARISAVLGARTLRLDDGREIRLAGLAALPPHHGARARLTLEKLVGESVTLHGETDAPDRYGRQPLLVIRTGAAQPIQSDLLAQGDALADLTLPACTTAFRTAEAGARRARAGVWGDGSVIKNAESPDDILAGVGHFAVVEGRVLSVRPSGSVTYVNFGQRWTRDFAVTMPSRVLPSFEAAGLPPSAFAGKRLRIRGFVERRGGPTGSPRIETIRPGQIEIVGADDLAISGE